MMHAAAEPQVSVILPAYNAEKYIEAAVRSILRQSFIDFELIVINDGSTDATADILEKLAREDLRVRLINRENRGLVASLNEGLDLARGVWIARMDADDIALPNRLERQLEWLQETKADICGSWVKFFGTTDRRVLKHAQSDRAVKMELLFGSPFAHPTVMMKTSLAKELSYDPAWEKCEDYDLWERAARVDWVMTNVPEVLLMYRQHEKQISTATSTVQQQLTQKIRRRYWNYVLESMGLSLDSVDEVLKIREPSGPGLNMNEVDRVFAELLRHHHGEARAVILDYMTRLYFFAASRCPDIAIRWGRLNDEFGDGSGLSVKLKLSAISLLKLHPEGVFFCWLKKISRGYGL